MNGRRASTSESGVVPLPTLCSDNWFATFGCPPAAIGTRRRRSAENRMSIDLSMSEQISRISHQCWSGDDFRIGSKAALTAPKCDFRFDLKTGLKRGNDYSITSEDGPIRRRRNSGRDRKACTLSATPCRAGRSCEASSRRAQRSSAAPASDTSNKASWLLRGPG